MLTALVLLCSIGTTHCRNIAESPDQSELPFMCLQYGMPADAVSVHGLTAQFLADKPLFGDMADEFLAFVGDAPLVAHNAGFDIAFLNAELTRAAKPPIEPERVVDTLELGRRNHPGGHNTLDDLCSRYGVNSPAQQRRA